jgi:uncharacterized protein (TIGR02246 family)
VVTTTVATTAISAVYEGFMRAVERGDADAISALYTEDAQILPPGGDIVSGRGALPAFWAATLGMGIKRCSFQTLEVEEHGDTAIEIGRVTLYGEGDIQIDTPKYLVVWKRHAGEWRMHRDIFNSDQPPA